MRLRQNGSGSVWIGHPAPIGAAIGPSRPEVIMAAIAHDRADASPSNDPERARQVRQAEELLFSGPRRGGSPRRCSGASSAATCSSPTPSCPPPSAPRSRRPWRAVRAFADASIDAAAIDREADIPRSVIDGLAKLGVLGMTAPAGVRRPRVLAAGLLPDHGGDRRPLLLDGRVRQRAPLDRHPGAAALRHARAEGPVAARRWPAARSWRPSP